MSKEGQAEMNGLVEYYMANAKVLRKVLTETAKLEVFGGDHSPYLWVRAPAGKSSWDMFDLMLEKCQIVITPGVGFGSMGEGFIRFSCFADQDKVVEAADRLEKFFGSHAFGGA